MPDSALRDKKGRLQLLKLEQARESYNTPPEMLIEIEDLERKIARLEYREQ